MIGPACVTTIGPHCGARHSTPVDSDDLTVLVEPVVSEFVVLRSPVSGRGTILTIAR